MRSLSWRSFPFSWVQLVASIGRVSVINLPVFAELRGAMGKSALLLESKRVPAGRVVCFRWVFLPIFFLLRVVFLILPRLMFSVKDRTLPPCGEPLHGSLSDVCGAALLGGGRRLLRDKRRYRDVLLACPRYEILRYECSWLVLPSRKLRICCGDVLLQLI